MISLRHAIAFAIIAAVILGIGLLLAYMRGQSPHRKFLSGRTGDHDPHRIDLTDMRGDTAPDESDDAKPDR